MAAPFTPADRTGGPYEDANPFVVRMSDKLTSGGGYSGDNPRIRVDVGEPSFFDGRQFRTFLEFDLLMGEEIVIKAVTPIDVILYGLRASIVSGEIRVETLAGGTEGGTLGTPLPIFGRNTMSEIPQPPYSPQVTLATGGTQSGGTLLDVILARTSGNSNFGSSVGAVTGDERGVGAGTYYFRLTAVEASRGIFRARWEERL